MATYALVTHPTLLFDGCVSRSRIVAVVVRYCWNPDPRY